MVKWGSLTAVDSTHFTQRVHFKCEKWEDFNNAAIRRCDEYYQPPSVLLMGFQAFHL